VSKIISIDVSPIAELERPSFGQFVRQVVPLTSAQLDECLRAQETTPKRLGEIMLERGLITRQQIKEVLSLQAKWVAAAVRSDIHPNTLPLPTFFSLCLPAFNEQAVIRETLDSACSILPEFVQRYEVIVVDDGSQDGTAETVAEYAKRDDCIRLVRHASNKGYGGAVTTGIRAARGEHVAFMDSDGQFSLLDLPQLLSRTANSDVVIGYRYRRADPWPRRFNAWAWNQLIRAVLGVRVRDLDCAFKIFTREVVERLNLTATGACINAEIMAQCVRGNLAIAEVPVAHYPRLHGDASGANVKVILQAFRELPQLRKYRHASLSFGGA
jgi:hypothetical protein